MTDFKKLIEDGIAANLASKPKFNILYVGDETSRLSYCRGLTAMQEFKHFYGNLADISLTSIDSKTFIRACPDLAFYNILWIDNISNRNFMASLEEKVNDVMNRIAPDWRKDAEQIKKDSEGDRKAYEDFQAEVDAKVAEFGDDEEEANKYLESVKEKLDALKEKGTAYEQYVADANAFRAMTLRVVYALDEFVWDAPAGRQNTIVGAMTVQETMQMADEVVVPNSELAGAIKDLNLVSEYTDVLVIPTFMNEYFYPINRIYSRMTSLSTIINKPKILVKGTCIPKNVQNFIIHGYDRYDFTICSVGELDERLMKLLSTPKDPKHTEKGPCVRNMVHWANPRINPRNIQKTVAIERDAAFDFTILTGPDDFADDIYNITMTDTDALIAIASGSVAIACIDDAGFNKGTHVCLDTGLTFGTNTKVDDIKGLIVKWSICSNWDQAFEKQKQYLITRRLVSAPNVMGGFFNAMLGRKLSLARKEKFGDGDTKPETKTAETVEEQKDGE
jgi:hypothetical protein